MRLPVVHLERTIDGLREKRTVNRTDYARDIGRWTRKGFKIVGWHDPADTPDAVVDFMRRQDEKELARAANPRHAASHDAERRYEHMQGRPEIADDIAEDTAPVASETTQQEPPKRKRGRPRKNA